MKIDELDAIVDTILYVGIALIIVGGLLWIFEK